MTTVPIGPQPPASPFGKADAAANPAELLDKLQVAELLRVCPGTVDNERKRGKLRAVKLGSRVLFDPADVAEYIQRQKESAESSRAVRNE